MTHYLLSIDSGGIRRLECSRRLSMNSGTLHDGSASPAIRLRRTQDTPTATGDARRAKPTTIVRLFIELDPMGLAHVDSLLLRTDDRARRSLEDRPLREIARSARPVAVGS